MKKTLAMLAVGTVLPLFAGEGIRFGARVSTTSPVGLLSRAVNQGVGLGLFATYDVCSGQTAVVRIDANHLGHHKQGGNPSSATSISSMTCGVDYKVHLNGAKTGLYGLVGVDLEHKRELLKKYHVEQPKPGVESAGGSKIRDNKTHFSGKKVGYGVGAGYDLNSNLGAQVRYDVHRYAKHTNSTASVGVSYTF